MKSLTQSHAGNKMTGMDIPFSDIIIFHMQTALHSSEFMPRSKRGWSVSNLPFVIRDYTKNPGFESGRRDWIFYTNGTGSFDVISPGFEGNNASQVRITMRSSNVQLYQPKITLKSNTHYRLSFAAKSSTGHDVTVVLLKHGSPFTNYGLGQNFNLTEDWQTFTTEFDTKRFNRNVNDGRLMFYLLSNNSIPSFSLQVLSLRSGCLLALLK